MISGRIQPAMEETAQEILGAVNNIEVQVDSTSGVLVSTDGKKYRPVMRKSLVFHSKSSSINGVIFYQDDDFIYSAGDDYIRRYDKDFNFISETKYPYYSTSKAIQNINKTDSFVILGDYAYGVSGDGAFNACYIFKFKLSTMEFLDCKPVTVYSWAAGTSTYSFQTKSIAYFNGKLILYANNSGSNSGGVHIFEIDPDNIASQSTRKLISNSAMPTYVKVVDGDKLVVVCTSQPFNNTTLQGTMFVFNTNYQLLNTFAIGTNINPNGGFKVTKAGELYSWANGSFQSVLIFSESSNSNILSYNSGTSTTATLEMVNGIPHLCLPGQIVVVTSSDIRGTLQIYRLVKNQAGTYVTEAADYFVFERFEQSISELIGDGYFTGSSIVRVNGPWLKYGELKFEHVVKSYVEVIE